MSCSLPTINIGLSKQRWLVDKSYTNLCRTSRNANCTSLWFNKSIDLPLTNILQHFIYSTPMLSLLLLSFRSYTVGVTWYTDDDNNHDILKRKCWYSAHKLMIRYYWGKCTSLLAATCHKRERRRRLRWQPRARRSTNSAGKYWENIITVNSSGHNNREVKIWYGDSSIRYDSRFLGCKCDYVINRLRYKMSNNVEKTAQNPSSFHSLS